MSKSISILLCGKGTVQPLKTTTNFENNVSSYIKFTKENYLSNNKFLNTYEKVICKQFFKYHLVVFMAKIIIEQVEIIKTSLYDNILLNS